jgi:hypothetical protein
LRDRWDVRLHRPSLRYPVIPTISGNHAVTLMIASDDMVNAEAVCQWWGHLFQLRERLVRGEPERLRHALATCLATALWLTNGSYENANEDLEREYDRWGIDHPEWTQDDMDREQALATERFVIRRDGEVGQIVQRWGFVAPSADSAS